MTREEPSLETFWLKNIKTMDKVQITDRSHLTLVKECNQVHRKYRIIHLNGSWVTDFASSQMHHTIMLPLLKDIIEAYVPLLLFSWLYSSVLTFASSYFLVP
jgi:hypothetical protein